MAHQKLLPVFAKISCQDGLRLQTVVKQCRQVARELCKVNSSLERNESEEMRFHGVAKSHFVKQVDFEFAVQGPVDDPNHKLVFDALRPYQVWRQYAWANTSMNEDITLYTGTRRREADLWFGQKRISQLCDGDAWKSHWKSVLDVFGFADKVRSVNVDGYEMPAFKEDVVIHKNNSTLDAQNRLVLAGHSEEYNRCYLNVNCPESSTFAEETMFKAVEVLTQLWGQEPWIETQFTHPNFGMNPTDFDVLNQVVIVWDHVVIRDYYGDPNKRFRSTYTPPLGEVMAIPELSLWDNEHPADFYNPLMLTRVHRHSDRCLEIQVHDVTLLQKFADATGLPVEQWVGDHVSRWGWYAPIQDGDHSIVLDPSPGSKAIVVPASKSARVTPATESAKTKPATKKSTKKK